MARQSNLLTPISQEAGDTEEGVENKHTLSQHLLNFPVSRSNDSGEAPPPPREWVSTTSQSLLQGAISGHDCAGDSAYEFLGDIEFVGEIPDAKDSNRKNQSRLV